MSTPGIVEKLLIVSYSVVRPLVTLGAPNGLGAAEAKAAAPHPKRYQSLLSKLSTRGERGGENQRRQSDWLSGDRQTG